MQPFFPFLPHLLHFRVVLVGGADDDDGAVVVTAAAAVSVSIVRAGLLERVESVLLLLLDDSMLLAVAVAPGCCLYEFFIYCDKKMTSPPYKTQYKILRAVHNRLLQYLFICLMRIKRRSQPFHSIRK